MAAWGGRGGRHGVGEGGTGAEGQRGEDGVICLSNLPTEGWSHQ